MGTRPEAIKLAPVIAALRNDQCAAEFETFVISTGQHRELLQQVVDLFEIRVDVELGVMQPNQTLAVLTANLLTALDGALDTIKPDLTIVQGDTTSVLCAALASYYRRIPVGHVEAGLRTGHIHAPFPEEVNRSAIAPIVELHFAPTQTARRNLLRENVCDGKIVVTGNTVIDALRMEVARQDEAALARRIDASLAKLIASDWSQRPFVLITGHRRENFGEGFDQICNAIAQLAARFAKHRFIYPVHLNPNVQKPVYDRLGALENVTLIDPVDYRLFVALMRRCALVLTDSGGVQEEAPSLGKPVLVMRETTERPEGVEAGTVKLVGANARKIVDGVRELLTDEAAYRAMSEAINPYGDGHAAGRIVQRIREFFHMNEACA